MVGNRRLAVAEVVGNQNREADRRPVAEVDTRHQEAADTLVRVMAVHKADRAAGTADMRHWAAAGRCR